MGRRDSNHKLKFYLKAEKSTDLFFATTDLYHRLQADVSHFYQPLRPGAGLLRGFSYRKLQ